MEYIENKELEQKEVKGIFMDIIKYAPSKLCGMFGNMIAVPIYTSLFSSEQYGIYTVSIAMLSFLCIIFSDWVGLSGLRFFRRYQLEENLPKYLTTLVAILFTNMLLMFGLAIVFSHQLYGFFVKNSDQMQSVSFFKYLIAVLVLIIPVAIRALLSQLLRAQLKSISYTIATIANQFATIALAVFFAKQFNLGALSILLAMGVSISLIDVLLLYQSELLKVFKFQKIEWKFILPIMKYGIPIAATSLSAWIMTQSNKIIMNNLSETGFSKAALVGVGYSLTSAILMTFFAMITVAAIPRIYNLYEAKIDVRPITSRFMGYYILTALPIVTLMSVFNRSYTQAFVANPKMYEASTLIPFLAFGVFFLALTDYTTLQYKLANKTHIDFIIKLISGLVGVALNIILIPKMGLIGVGIATLIGNFLYFLLSTIIVLPNLNLFFPKNILIKMLISALPMILLVYICKLYSIGLTNIWIIITFLALYYTLYFISGKLFKKIID